MTDKPVTAWTIKTPSGILLPSWVNPFMECCIRAFTENSSPWEKYLEYGYSCVKVEIREVLK